MIAPVQSWAKILKSFERIMILFTLTIDLFYSMEEEPELIDYFTNIIGPNRDLFDFIKGHDCFLNLPEADIDKTH